MPDERPIVPIEDYPGDIRPHDIGRHDIGLTVAAVAKCQLANDIIVARGGAKARFPHGG